MSSQQKSFAKPAQLSMQRTSDVHAKSNRWKKLVAALKSTETSKKKKYLQACQHQWQHFMLLVYSAEGIPGQEMLVAEKQLASTLKAKLEQLYLVMAALVQHATANVHDNCLSIIPPPPRHAGKMAIR